MILLLGGTTETPLLAEAIASAGFKVLVTTVTGIPLYVGRHGLISRRCGELDQEGMVRMVTEQDLRAIVDATHPYATKASANARAAARETGIPYLRWLRPPAVPEAPGILRATDHQGAAQIAFSQGRPVLLTTGSKHLEPYVGESRRTGITLVVRVLPRMESINGCLEAGIPREHILTGRGPFSLEQNISCIRGFGIGVLVTKDSGIEGGVPEKLKAAAMEGCCVVVLERPEEGPGINHVKDLIEALQQLVSASI